MKTKIGYIMMMVGCILMCITSPYIQIDVMIAILAAFLFIMGAFLSLSPVRWWE